MGSVDVTITWRLSVDGRLEVVSKHVRSVGVIRLYNKQLLTSANPNTKHSPALVQPHTALVAGIHDVAQLLELLVCRR